MRGASVFVPTTTPRSRRRGMGSPAAGAASGRVEAEVHEEAAPVVAVLLDAVVEPLDVLLIEEPQDLLLELPRSLTRDDFDKRGALLDRLVDDAAQRLVDLGALVEDVVQIQLELHDARPPCLPTHVSTRCSADE